MVEDIRAKAGLGPVRVKTKALSPGNRVAMVVNGTADIECDLTIDNSGCESQLASIPSVFFGKAQILVTAIRG